MNTEQNKLSSKITTTRNHALERVLETPLSELSLKNFEDLVIPTIVSEFTAANSEFGYNHVIGLHNSDGLWPDDSAFQELETTDGKKIAGDVYKINSHSVTFRKWFKNKSIEDATTEDINNAENYTFVVIPWHRISEIRAY